jgi:hypothetical protein
MTETLEATQPGTPMKTEKRSKLPIAFLSIQGLFLLWAVGGLSAIAMIMTLWATVNFVAGAAYVIPKIAGRYPCALGADCCATTPVPAPQCA